MIPATCHPPGGDVVDFREEKIDQSIPARFEIMVRQYPDRLAVKMGERALTYAELNKTANRIARAIVAQRGEGSEPVGLLFEQGIDVIAALFGVLKAGKFYIALDPSFPTKRNIYVLEDSQAGVIVTNTQNLKLAHGLTAKGCAVINIDEIVNGILSDNLALSVAPEDRLSIHYTSGSTGNPKGVVKVHRNSGSSAAETRIVPDDRLSLLHSVSFGSASFSLYSSLLNGASLFPFDVRSEGVHRMADWLVEEQITICHLPPALFRELAGSISTPKRFTRLRLIRLSGAPITQRDFDLYKENFSSGTFLNLNMGSTETGGIFSAIVDHKFVFPREGTPLGYPRLGKKVLLLDDDGREVGPNQVGEIAIKGNHLNPGYWRRPELTSTKFRSDSNGGDERIYRTGDVGRILPDGFLIHLGRKDSMVKIRGYRVEIGEVERVLLAHPQVREVGVVAWDREPGEKYLVAYLVPRHDVAPAINDLFDFLRGKLPDYMIPSAFVFLPSLPLANGKLDRTALPLPDSKRPDMRHPYVSPKTAVEQKLVGIWEEILQVHPIGINDDFFNLGGHSLLAASVFVQIDKAFGKQLPVTTLFYARTIEQLAGVLRQDGWSAPSSLLVPIQPTGSKPPLFWASGGPSDFLLARHLGQDQPLYVIMHQCHDGKRARYARLENLAAYHLEEIRTVQPQGPYFLGGSCFEGMVAFEMAQQLRQQGQEVALLILLDLASIKNCKFIANQVSTSDESMRDEALRHFSMLAKLNSQAKLKYVWVRFNDRIQELVAGISKVAVRSICKIYVLTGQTVPLSLRLTYISEVDRKILRVYELQPYPGRLVYFQAERSSINKELVARLSCGQLETDEVSGGHSDLGNEPHVAVWAKKLKASLEQAQAEELRKQLKTCADYV